MIVSDYIGVPKRGKDRKLGMELFPFFLRHANVVDLLATEDLAILLPAYFPDNTKGTMSYKALVFATFMRLSKTDLSSPKLHTYLLQT